VQADWDSELFGKRFRGNVGLRGYQTDTHSTGWIQGDSYAYLGTTDVKGSYSGVLPALNTVLELTPEVLLRFAASQNLNRPGLGSMAAEGSAFKDENSGEITASRGNPNLKPYKDTTLDVSAGILFRQGRPAVGQRVPQEHQQLHRVGDARERPLQPDGRAVRHDPGRDGQHHRQGILDADQRLGHEEADRRGTGRAGASSRSCRRRSTTWARWRTTPMWTPTRRSRASRRPATTSRCTTRPTRWGLRGSLEPPHALVLGA
jgi:hypothetical protein